MKLDPETREKAAQDAHAAAYYPNLTNWDLLPEGSRNVWRRVADAVAATIPEPTPDDGPRPINPADVRVGDRVVARIEATELIERLEEAVRTLKQIQGGGDRIHGKIEGVNLALSYAREHRVLYLLDRPDPDADLIRTIGSVLTRMEGGQWVSESAAILAALRETHTIEPRPTGGDLHA